MYRLITILIFYFLLFLLLKVRQLKIKQARNYVAISLFIFLLSSTIPIQSLISQAVYFINVGQGDAILIQNKRHAVLLDTGGLSYLDVAKVSLIPLMKKQGIKQLDAVFISHDDFDHNGALPSLKQHFKVAEVINDVSQFPNRYANIDFINLNVYATSNDDDNYQSLVIYFHFMNAYWLMMGDAPLEIEQQIVNDNGHLPVDYLKIGHHGSNTSTCEAFLDLTKPKEVIISVGQNNYGHPHHAVITLINKKGIKIRRTDQEGTIVYRKVSK